MALMIQASDCNDFRAHIEDAGKCALDETGKYQVNENDEEEFACVSIRDECCYVIASEAKQSIVLLGKYEIASSLRSSQ